MRYSSKFALTGKLLATDLQLLQPFNGLFSRTTWVSRYQKGETNLDFTGARDSEWQWHQLRYDTRCYFNVRSKADMNRLNLPHGDDN